MNSEPQICQHPHPHHLHSRACIVSNSVDQPSKQQLASPFLQRLPKRLRPLFHGFRIADHEFPTLFELGSGRRK